MQPFCDIIIGHPEKLQPWRVDEEDDDDDALHV